MTIVLSRGWLVRDLLLAVVPGLVMAAVSCADDLALPSQEPWAGPGGGGGHCAACCPVRPDQFGFYATQWRPWPGWVSAAAPRPTDGLTPAMPPPLGRAEYRPRGRPCPAASSRRAESWWRIMREAGVEPARLAALEPKSSASASSATLAWHYRRPCCRLIMASAAATQHAVPRRRGSRFLKTSPGRTYNSV